MGGRAADPGAEAPYVKAPVLDESFSTCVISLWVGILKRGVCAVLWVRGGEKVRKEGAKEEDGEGGGWEVGY